MVMLQRQPAVTTTSNIATKQAEVQKPVQAVTPTQQSQEGVISMEEGKPLRSVSFLRCVAKRHVDPLNYPNTLINRYIL